MRKGKDQRGFSVDRGIDPTNGVVSRNPYHGEIGNSRVLWSEMSVSMLVAMHVNHRAIEGASFLLESGLKAYKAVAFNPWKLFKTVNRGLTNKHNPFDVGIFGRLKRLADKLVHFAISRIVFTTSPKAAKVRKPE